MRPGVFRRSAARASEHVPGLRRVPAAKLLAAAELAMLAREHVARLSPSERRRVLELIRVGRGRPSKLSLSQRAELAALLARMEPRLFAGHVVDKLSPFPLPRRFVFGSSRSSR